MKIDPPHEPVIRKALQKTAKDVLDCMCSAALRPVVRIVSPGRGSRRGRKKELREAYFGPFRALIADPVQENASLIFLRIIVEVRLCSSCDHVLLDNGR
jgi:hypothetical protein